MGLAPAGRARRIVARETSRATKVAPLGAVERFGEASDDSPTRANPRGTFCRASSGERHPITYVPRPAIHHAESLKMRWSSRHNWQFIPMRYEPLSGIRVLDLTAVVVGPAATWRLGQYGAEIIKVENPEGDLMRGLGGLSPTGQHAGAYLHLNRGKRNICLNLKAEGSAEVMQRLIAWADVIVANMRPKALARLGLDPETVRAKHPEKIYCLLTGYGSDGPYGGFPTYDSVVQGAVGLPGLTMARDGEPKYVPLLICDHVVGEIAAGVAHAARPDVIADDRSAGRHSIRLPRLSDSMQMSDTTGSAGSIAAK